MVLLPLRIQAEEKEPLFASESSGTSAAELAATSASVIVCMRIDCVHPSISLAPTCAPLASRSLTSDASSRRVTFNIMYGYEAAMSAATMQYPAILLDLSLFKITDRICSPSPRL